LPVLSGTAQRQGNNPAKTIYINDQTLQVLIHTEIVVNLAEFYMDAM